MSSNLGVVAALIAVLLLVTFPIAQRLAVREQDERFFWLLMVSTAVRFVCTFMQVYVAKHAYNGVADFTGYESHGAAIAASIRAGHFSAGSTGYSGNGTVNVVTGFVFAIIGNDQIGGFIVFSFLAMLGLVAFYGAFRIAVPDGDRIRYAVLLFLLPSLLFWSSAIGKEALMTLFLGVSANGAARLLSSQRGALVRLAAGMALGTLLRPNETIILFAGLCIAFLVARSTRLGRFGFLGLLGWVALLAAAGFVLFAATAHFLHLHTLSPSAVTKTLHRTNTNNSGVGAGFGSSNYTYSSSPLHFFQDAYTVLFDPLPFQAHSVTQLLAAAENLVVLGVLLASLGRLKTMLGSLLRRPYITLCLAYSLAFLYFFASLGNLGLLDRERTLLFPFLLVLICLPRRPVVAQTNEVSGLTGQQRPVSPSTRTAITRS